MKNKSKVKKLILLSGLVAVMLCSCMNEDTDGCPAMRNLVFSHYSEYDPDDNFDHKIANDVLLCVYRNNILKDIERIPYEKIQGGKAYSYRKPYGGNIKIAAWAVPSGSLTPVPQWNYDENFEGQFLDERSKTRAKFREPFAKDLHLGTVFLTDDDIAVETTHEVKMIDVACLVQITVANANGMLNDPSKELYAVLNGTMSAVNLLYQGVQEESEVFASLAKETDDSYTTGYFGALPSAEKQSVSVSVYYGDDCIVTIRAGRRAVSGGRIIMNITLGTGVYVNINGFEVVPSEVKWM